MMDDAKTKAVYDALGKVADAVLDLRSLFAPPPVPPPVPYKVPLGINLSAVVDFGTEMPFADVMKTARPFYSQVYGKSYDEGLAVHLALDDHGWPEKLEAGQFAETILFTNGQGSAWAAGAYTLQVPDGVGSIEFNGMAAGVFAVRADDTLRSWRVIVDSKAASFLAFRITTTDPTNPIRNITLTKTGDSGVFRAPFVRRYTSPDFVSLLTDEPYRVIRFMDWMGTNNDTDERGWSGRPVLKDSMYTTPYGVPLEVVLDLCRITGTAPWICFHHKVTDDYIALAGDLVGEFLQEDRNRKVYLEYSNEVWNTNLPQHAYCQAAGTEDFHNMTDPYEATMRWYAKTATRVFDLFARNSLGLLAQEVRVLSTHHRDIRTGQWVLDEAGGTQVNAIAVAPYFGATLIAQAAAVKSGSMEHRFAMLAEDQLQGNQATRDYAALAAANKVALFAYEGGQHLVAPNDEDTELASIFRDMNRHPLMKVAYTSALTNWQQDGGGLYVAFASMSPYDRWGSWGVLENEDQTTSPKLEAFEEYANG